MVVGFVLGSAGVYVIQRRGYWVVGRALVGRATYTKV
jgi:hypothetical protein